MESRRLLQVTCEIATFKRFGTEEFLPISILNLNVTEQNTILDCQGRGVYISISMLYSCLQLQLEQGTQTLMLSVIYLTSFSINCDDN